MAQENQYQDAKGAPVDRSTDTHRVVAIDPNNPIHQSIINNPQGSNVLIKNGYLHFPKPDAHREDAPAAKPESKPTPAPAKPKPKPAPAPAKPAPAPTKPTPAPAPAAPAKPAKKKSEPKKTGMAALADKEKAKREAIARNNARIKAQKLGK
jgi:outer membrane biosynthesis protein TonB